MRQIRFTLRTSPPAGTANVLADLAAARQSVVNLSTAVTKYYQQASYGKLKVTFDVTLMFSLMDNQPCYFSATAPNGTDPGYPNFIKHGPDPQRSGRSGQNRHAPVQPRLYHVLFIVVHLVAGTFVRAWGGGPVGPHFNYVDNVSYTPLLNIDFIITNTPRSATIQDTSDWGRVAHEFGHNIIGPASTDPTFISPGDLYDSDLPPGADTSAMEFDLMDDHDSCPLFSAYDINSLGWYKPANVRTLNWDRSPNLFKISRSLPTGLRRTQTQPGSISSKSTSAAG